MPPMGSAVLVRPLPAGGTRTEYWRAALSTEGLVPLGNQSSGRIATLAAADALIPHEAGAEPIAAGETVGYIALHQGSA